MNEKHADESYPCQACEACCAAYRASFYWPESDERALPAELTEQLNPWLVCMAGINCRSPRSIALDGQIGDAMACRVYEKRPSLAMK